MDSDSLRPIDVENCDEGKDGISHSGNLKRPTLERSWGVIMDQVNLYDEGLLQGWKEDIDTLLVFTGLFSAVVTAFTVESYQWLSERPEDASVVLLRQLTHWQINNQTISTPEPFQILPSDVRINTYWFLSLIIALVDALFGLLCKQWLREHRKPTHTRTPSEALALRWLRHESLSKWRVPTILAALPILLELALFLFLAGLLELLWSRHKVPFALAAAIVGFAVLFYLATTFIPGIDIIRQALQVTPELRKARVGRGPVPLNPSPAEFIMTLPPMELICPYKSPQAWIAFKASRALSRLPAFTKILYFFSSKQKSLCTLLGTQRISVWKTWALHNTLNELFNWSSVDLEVIQRSSLDLVPPYYELKAFRWLVRELQDSPAMIPHLQNVLETLPPHLAMPAVFDQWLFLPGREWRTEDIGRVLKPGPGVSDWGIEDHKTVFQLLFLDDDRTDRTTIFDRMLHYNHVLINGSKLSARDYQGLERVLESIWGNIVESSRRDISDGQS
ncbi:hypothetical protein PM082_022203 [Marasmius tenuissimus]|nr:hypothetical protein PM082_022203 [Marasmius tenuissimus]